MKTFYLIWWLGNVATMDPTPYATEALCTKALYTVQVEHPTAQGSCHLKTTPEE